MTHSTVRGYDSAGRLTFTAHFETAGGQYDKVWLYLVGEEPGEVQDTHRTWITRVFYEEPLEAGKFQMRYNVLVSR